MSLTYNVTSSPSSISSSSFLEAFQDTNAGFENNKIPQSCDEIQHGRLSSVMTMNSLLSVSLVGLSISVASGVTLPQMIETMTMVFIVPLNSGLDAWLFMLEVYLAQKKKERRRVLMMRLKKRIAIK